MLKFFNPAYYAYQTNPADRSAVIKQFGPISKGDCVYVLPKPGGTRVATEIPPESFSYIFLNPCIYLQLAIRRPGRYGQNPLRFDNISVKALIAELQKYSGPLEVLNLVNNFTEESKEAIITAIKGNQVLFQNIKAVALGGTIIFAKDSPSLVSISNQQQPVYSQPQYNNNNNQ